jgi:hypothetical protein
VTITLCGVEPLLDACALAEPVVPTALLRLPALSVALAGLADCDELPLGSTFACDESRSRSRVVALALADVCSRSVVADELLLLAGALAIVATISTRWPT